MARDSALGGGHGCHLRFEPGSWLGFPDQANQADPLKSSYRSNTLSYLPPHAVETECVARLAIIFTFYAEKPSVINFAPIHARWAD